MDLLGCIVDAGGEAIWRLGALHLPRPVAALHHTRSLFQLRNVLQWYAKEFKDPLLQDPPEWFKSFVFCELVFQLPFFPFAAYAFFKG